MVLLALAGCGRGFMTAERPAWRHQAEAQCMQSGAVKLGGGVVQISPIEGPGMCGADFPLKVAALGESSSRLGYSDVPRPSGEVGRSANQPNWPPVQSRYAPQAPAASAPAPQLRWTPGPPAIAAPAVTPGASQARSLDDEMYDPRPVQRQTYPQRDNLPPAQPLSAVPPSRPVSIYPPGIAAPETREVPDDVPDDAILPGGSQPSSRQASPPPVNSRSTYAAPPPQPRALPALGPMRGPQSTGSIMPAALMPPATLSCPIVSALERWVTDGVQPAALHWFGAQVTEIKQISAYSCRGMNGAGGHGISEHAFGNALDIAGFTLADGRKISVQQGWRGTPEEQGFLHDVQLFACETFVTVLAPGYNAAHYNHIHVDLMRRQNGRRPCRPDAIKGEVVAARARAVYAARHGGNITGALGDRAKGSKGATSAVPGADGLDDDVTGSIARKEAEAIMAVAGADGESEPDDEPTGSIGPATPSTGWPRLAPQGASRPDPVVR